MTRTKMMCALLLVCGLMMSPQPALAGGTDFSKFPLTKAIPADVFVAVAARENPERQFLDAYWAEVGKAFWQSGIMTDVWDMAADSMSDEQVEEVEALHEKFATLFHEVQWGALFGKEMIHVGRMVMPKGQISSLYEGALLGRMDEKNAAANYQSLKALLGEIVKFAEAKGGEGTLRLEEEKLDDLTVVSLMPGPAPFHIICIGQYKDVIAISFAGRQIMTDCIDLLRGKGELKPLVNDERFKKAFATLPAAEDELFFFSPPSMFGPVSNVLKMFGGGKGPKGGEKPSGAEESEGEPGASEGESEEAAVVGTIARVIDDISIFDHIAGVEWTDGYSVHSQTLTRLTKDARKSPFYDILATKCAGQKYDRFVPKEAKTFSCSSGINLTKLYHYGRDLVMEVAPEGKQLLAEFDRLQKEQWELNIERDILALFEGPMISVQMGTDSVFMLKVSDEAAANARVKNLFARLNDVLGQENALQFTAVDVEGAKFTQISHPMMMMAGVTSPPLIGCAEGHLIIGTNAKSVTRCLRTAAGKHPSVVKNTRFAKEGLMPSKGEEIDSISFTDESNTAQELQQVIGMMSMAMGFAGMGMAEAPPQVQAIFQGVPPILAKLGPVAGKMDFFQSSAEVCTFDGDTYMTRAVQNYKEPRPESESENGEEPGETEGDEAP